MNLAKFNIGYSETEKLLKLVGLFSMKGVKHLNTDGVSDAFLKASQDENYLRLHFVGAQNYDFDFLLVDNSFLQFEYKEVNGVCEIRYAYFQNPTRYKSYEDYLQEQINEGSIEEMMQTFGNTLEAEYSQFLNEQDAISNYSTIRYDFDSPNYRPLIHSSSHIHIGHLSNIRLPMNRTISPLMFTLFVIKHVYYDEWKMLVDNHREYLIDILKSCKSTINPLGKESWDLIEELELFFS